MTLPDRSRRAAAVGLGSLALVLAGGPAFAATAASTLNSPVPQLTELLLTEPLQPVLDAVDPVVAPVVDPVVEVVASASPEPTEQPAPAVDGPGSEPAAVVAPAQPAGQGPATSAPAATAAAAADTGDSFAAGSQAAALSSLSTFARGVTGGDGLAALSPFSNPTIASSLALPGLLPSTALSQDFLPAGESGGPASLPALLVWLAATAVAVTATAHASEVRRRRQLVGQRGGAS